MLGWVDAQPASFDGSWSPDNKALPTLQAAAKEAQRLQQERDAQRRVYEEEQVGCCRNMQQSLCAGAAWHLHGQQHSGQTVILNLLAFSQRLRSSAAKNAPAAAVFSVSICVMHLPASQAKLDAEIAARAEQERLIIAQQRAAAKAAEEQRRRWGRVPLVC